MRLRGTGDGTGKKTQPRKIRSATPASVRGVNRAIILSLIRLHAPISRAGLSEKSGIFRSNVSEIVDGLIASGLVRERRAVPVGRGRVPFHLYLNDPGFHVLAVSIRPDSTQVAFAGLTGEIRKSLRFETPQAPRQFIKEVRTAVRTLRHSMPESTGQPFEQACVSVPGLVDAARGRVLWLPALPDYSGFPLREELEKIAGIPVTLDNDSNLAALAEMWLEDQSGTRLDDFVFLEIGDFGAGAGVVLNHSLYRGHDSTFVAEFGHMVVDPAGPQCECGRRGCWELFVCNRSTWARWSPSEFRAERFAEMIQAAKKGERRAVKAFQETAHYLSVGISNIVLAFNPEVVLVTGRIAGIWDIVGPVVVNAPTRLGVKLSVRPARLQTDEMFLQGAVSYAVGQAFAQPDLGF
jgi:predicted NBD/HSP70 family sugar kinase